MMIRKVISVLIVVLLIQMFAVTAFAADITLALSAQSCYAGDSIEISGTYDPEEWITVRVLDAYGNIVYIKPVLTAEDSAYCTTFVVPDMEPGTLQIIAGNGSDVESADYTVKETPVPTASPTASSETNTTSSATPNVSLAPDSSSTPSSSASAAVPVTADETVGGASGPCFGGHWAAL